MYNYFCIIFPFYCLNSSSLYYSIEYFIYLRCANKVHYYDYIIYNCAFVYVDKCPKEILLLLFVSLSLNRKTRTHKRELIDHIIIFNCNYKQSIIHTVYCYYRIQLYTMRKL